MISNLCKTQQKVLKLNTQLLEYCNVRVKIGHIYKGFEYETWNIFHVCLSMFNVQRVLTIILILMKMQSTTVCELLNK